MNNFISIHSYLLLNAAIAISYLLLYFIQHLSPFKQLTQLQQLKFSRFTFIAAIILFLLMPFLIKWLHYSNNFQLPPIIKHASTFILHHPKTLVATNYVKNSTQIVPVFNILFFILIGCGVCFIKYIKTILTLIKITKKAYSQRVIHGVSLLYSNNITIPCCWSLINKHFIIIPVHFLENKTDLQLAIRHELQHLRQGDTYWLHFFAIIKIMCFWNPMLLLWNKRFEALQEFACDEALIIRKKTSRIAYAQCLIDSAAYHVLPKGALGIIGFNQFHSHTLKRRVNMLFNYQNVKKSKKSLVVIYGVCLLATTSLACALGDSAATQSLSAKQISGYIHKVDHMNIVLRPEVINEINQIRSNKDARQQIISAMERMQQYQPLISAELTANKLPHDLLALPLLESGYRPLDASQNQVSAAGIWQIIPTTAKGLGLVVEGTRDDRLDTKLSTKAAITYLKTLYSQFNDWKLAVVAYEYGEKRIASLIEKVGSQDVWVIANSPLAPADFKNFLARFESYVIIMNNPKLVS